MDMGRACGLGKLWVCDWELLLFSSWGQETLVENEELGKIAKSFFRVVSDSVFVCFVCESRS